jgi:threonine dehydrogenase-like Zn-dependent dehydrogenase
MRNACAQGHECMGIVESVGPEVKKIKPGDRVVVAFDVACGKCDHCKRGEFTGCQKTNPSKLIEGLYGHGFAGILGFAEIAGGYSGAQAEYIRVPFGDVGCLNVPDTMPDDVALYLSDIACTSYHAAIDLGQVHSGDNVAIWGAGPIGFLVAKWCEIFGAKNIYVIDNVPERMALVQDKVANVTVLNFEEVRHVDMP